MKKITLAYTLFLTLLLCSCDPKPKTVQEEPKKEEVKVGNLTQEVFSYRERKYTDSVQVSGKTYVYEYSLTNCDTLPKVRNSEGDYYYDNQLSLHITKSGTNIYSHTFTKSEFKEFVPETMLQKSIIVGFTFNPLNTADPANLHFFLTVGNPDETADEDYTIDICITPTGSKSMTIAENLETESLSPEMNVNPTE